MLQLLSALVICFTLIFAPAAHAVVGMKESDGSPDFFPWQIIVQNDTLTENADGTATYDPSGGSGGDSVTVDSAATVDPNFQDSADIGFAYSSPNITASVNWANMDSIQSAGINWDDVEVVQPLTEAMISDLGSYLTSVQSSDINWADVDAAEIQSAGINWDDVETLAPITEAMIGDLGSYIEAADVTANETDPVYSGDPAAGITAGHITNWDTAYGWGDHSIVGYLTSVQSSDVNWADVAANELQQSGINWDSIPNFDAGKVLVWRSSNNVNWESPDAVSIGADSVQSSNINWEDINSAELQSAGINWDDVDAAEIQSAGINWVDTGVLNEFKAMPLAGTDPDVDAAGEIGRDTDDFSLRGYDGSNQFVYGQEMQTINFTIATPLDLDEADALPVWWNSTPFSFIITALKAWSDTDDVAFTLNELNSATNWDDIATIKAETIDQDGTGVYTNDAQTTLTGNTIEAGHGIAFDNDAEDDPAYIKISLEGRYDADVA